MTKSDGLNPGREMVGAGGGAGSPCLVMGLLPRTAATAVSVQLQAQGRQVTNSSLGTVKVLALLNLLKHSFGTSLITVARTTILKGCTCARVNWYPTWGAVDSSPQPGSSRWQDQSKGKAVLPQGEGRVEIPLCPDTSSCLQKMLVVFFSPWSSLLHSFIQCSGDDSGVTQGSLLALNTYWWFAEAWQTGVEFPACLQNPVYFSCVLAHV